MVQTKPSKLNQHIRALDKRLSEQFQALYLDIDKPHIRESIKTFAADLNDNHSSVVVIDKLRSIKGKAGVIQVAISLLNPQAQCGAGTTSTPKATTLEFLREALDGCMESGVKVPEAAWSTLLDREIAFSLTSVRDADGKVDKDGLAKLVHLLNFRQNQTESIDTNGMALFCHHCPDAAAGKQADSGLASCGVPRLVQEKIKN